MSETESPTPAIGRNEPCPCGSGKKYKRCCGVSAAPKLSAPKAGNPFAGGGAPGGFDPSQLDPQWMMQFTQQLQRLPKGQMQRLQAMMQKAMSGKDVSREAEQFEKTLPVELQTLMHAAPMEQLAKMGQAVQEESGQGAEGEAAPEMTPEEAKRIVEAAAAAGKIDSGQAEELIKGAEAGGSKFSKFWRNLKG